MKELRVRGRVARVLLLLNVVVGAAALLLQSAKASFFLDVIATGSADLARAEALDAQEAALRNVAIAAFFLCAVAFLVWTYRAHANLRAARLRRLRYEPGEAVSGYLVPILNLWRPIRVMREAWQGSSHLAGDSGAASWRDAPISSLVGWWWTMFLLMGSLSSWAARVESTSPDVHHALRATWLRIGSCATGMLAAGLAYALVAAITDMQEKARGRLRAGLPPGPPAAPPTPLDPIPAWKNPQDRLRVR